MNSSLYGRDVPPVRLVVDRRYDPRRLVDVEHEGVWWPGLQHAWRLCDDDRGWMAEVEHVVQYDWVPGKRMILVSADRVRPREDSRA